MKCARLLPIATMLGLACTVPRATLEEMPSRSAESCGLVDPVGALDGLDVAIAIAVSSSTSQPIGFDADADGIVGVRRHSRVTDLGDSLLAAQVSAVKSFVQVAAEHDARVSLVAYAGRTEAEERSTPVGFVSPRIAWPVVENSGDTEELEAGLAGVLARGSRGGVDFTAALIVSLHALLDAEPTEIARRRAIVLLSHSATPVLGAPTLVSFRTPEGADPNGAVLHHDPDLLVAVMRAIRKGVRIHTIGLGRAAYADPPHLLRSIGLASGGSYHEVRDAKSLHCSVFRALSAPPSAPAETDPEEALQTRPAW